MQLVLVPFREVDPGDCYRLADDLSFLAFDIEVAPPIDMPHHAYDAHRDQYIANVLLDRVKQQPGERVLGITERDMYQGRLNFVFGIAELAGRAAIISFHRLRYDANGTTFYKRAVKEAVHELGHTFGMDHCDNPMCVMHFSNALRDTDIKNKFYCARCMSKIPQRLKQELLANGTAQQPPNPPEIPQEQPTEEPAPDTSPEVPGEEPTGVPSEQPQELPWETPQEIPQETPPE